MVSPRAVVEAATHTALVEICVPNHKGRDHFGPTSQRVPYPRVQRGKPRFTFVSEGKPLRRLLVISYRNSSSTAFLLPDGFARHITEEEDHDYCRPAPKLRGCRSLAKRGVGHSPAGQCTFVFTSVNALSHIDPPRFGPSPSASNWSTYPE